MERVSRTSRSAEFAELSALLFIQAAAMGAWFVPIGSVLDTNGYQAIKPLAFATSAVAAFISPLIFGALADRSLGPVRVLRILGIATACAMSLAAYAIGKSASPIVVLALIQLYSLCSSPTWGIASSIVLGRLLNPQREFGPVRSLGSLGWMVGCWTISLLGADTSIRALYAAGCIWLLVVALTFWLKSPAPIRDKQRLTISQRLGWDALVLLRNPGHRAVFLTTALFAIPLAAYYPFSPTHLRALGLQRTAAWMTFGQVTEVIAMFALAALMGRLRLKRTICIGLAFGVFRFGLCAFDTRASLLAGITLHGFSFTLVFITAQLYLDSRIDPAWRARAQALFAVMTGGVGNLLGYLGTGAWFTWSARAGADRWSLFWAGLSAFVLAILIHFAITQRRDLLRPSA